jgi:hypothetical protein
MARLATVVIVGALLVGCGTDYDTNRDALIAIGNAYCGRAAECGVIGSAQVEECVNGFVGDACNDIDCQAAPRASSDDIDQCIDALGVLSCTADNLPAVCNSIL